MSGRTTFLGCPLDRVDMEEADAWCLEAVEMRRGARHAALNAAKAVAMQTDSELREAVAGSDLITADGQAIVWGTRLLGDPVRERVTGIDLMERLLAESAVRGHRVFFLGATPEALRQAVERLKVRYPGLVVAGSHHGYFRDDDSAGVRVSIGEAKPDLLFVAMGTPQKELWLARHTEELGVPFAMGVGGALDVVAGNVRRAPSWVGRAGLEWAFRLAQEPRRLWRRYLITNVKFTVLLARELVRVRHRRGLTPNDRT